jgi:hypothetical protein
MAASDASSSSTGDRSPARKASTSEQASPGHGASVTPQSTTRGPPRPPGGRRAYFFFFFRSSTLSFTASATLLTFSLTDAPA